MDRPILFSAPMIRAILEGRKSQTRRVIAHNDGAKPVSSPRIQVGDRLWVREAWRSFKISDHLPPRELEPQTIWWEADGDGQVPANESSFGRLRPGIHMPRWTSRLTLIVTDVRVMLLQDISPEDAAAEGVTRRSRKVRQFWLFGADAAEREWIYLQACPWEFRDLWDSLNDKRGLGWETNPWVMAVTFTVIKVNIDQLPADTRAPEAANQREMEGVSE